MKGSIAVVITSSEAFYSACRSKLDPQEVCMNSPRLMTLAAILAGLQMTARRCPPTRRTSSARGRSFLINLVESGLFKEKLQILREGAV
jgi:hypothetical protein